MFDRGRTVQLSELPNEHAHISSILAGIGPGRDLLATVREGSCVFLIASDGSILLQERSDAVPPAGGDRVTL